MRLCRFGSDRLGVVERETVRDVTAALDVLPAYRYPFPPHDVLIASLEKVLARVKEVLPEAPAVPLAGVELLSPVANPGKIIAAPVNYQKHLDEVKGDSQIHAGNPAHTVTIQNAGLFLKATSSLAGAGEGIAVVKPDRRTDHEVELVVVIGRPARHVPRTDALRYVAGYCIGLDVSIRGSEDRSFRKSPDSYSVLGPWLVTADDIPDPGGLDLQLSVNGTLRQKSNTSYLILGVPELIELASSFYTLYPGDVIFTGTPEGVSPIQSGDEISASVERIGTMDVRVRAADAPGVPAMSAAGEGLSRRSAPGA
jgi:2-keto-4-pentenoate hydratase/2-oxohepta-3-ene-1,7-dioic acid hydratase in catechol pathway